MPMIIDRIVDHALNTRFEDLPSGVVEAARLRLIDVLGCAIGGARADSSRAMLELVRSWGGAAQAWIIGQPDRVPLHQAAMLNSLLARSFDFEVCGPEAEGVNAGKMVGHVCSTTDVTALSAGDFAHSSGRELLTAVVVGGDIGARMAVADVFDFDRNFEVCGTVNALGAVAVAGRLLGADHAQLVDAYGIVLHLLGGSYQSLWDGVDSFKLPGAMSASHAVMAVQMAMRGFKGVRDPLGSRLGYFAMFGNRSQPETALEGLGEVYYAHGSHKLHPSCYGCHNPIDCALDLVSAHAFAVEDVVEVELDVPPNRVVHFLNQPMGPADAQPRALFSIPYAIANVLMRRGAEPEHYIAPAILDPRVQALSARVLLQPRLPLGNNQACRLNLRLRDGRVLSAERTGSPRGWPAHPATADQVRTKYWRNVEFAGLIDRRGAAAALDALGHLEDLADASTLVRGLSVPG